MRYKLNIPIYAYNTGRADNRKTIEVQFYEDRLEALKDRDFLNEIFNREKVGNDKTPEVTEEEIEKIDRLIETPGHQIKDAYVSMITEIIIPY